MNINGLSYNRLMVQTRKNTLWLNNKRHKSKKNIKHILSKSFGLRDFFILRNGLLNSNRQFDTLL